MCADNYPWEYFNPDTENCHKIVQEIKTWTNILERAEKSKSCAGKLEWRKMGKKH